MKDPMKPREWQLAVNAADAALALASAKAYGLIAGGPVVDMARALDLLARGKALGYVPRPEALEQFIHALANNFKKSSVPRSAQSAVIGTEH